MSEAEEATKEEYAYESLANEQLNTNGSDDVTNVEYAFFSKPLANGCEDHLIAQDTGMGARVGVAQHKSDHGRGQRGVRHVLHVLVHWLESR